MTPSDVRLAASHRAVDLAAAARSVPLLGRSVTCPLCGWSFRHFTAGGRSSRRRPNGYCPRCNSKVRHRWLWLNMVDIMNPAEADRIDVLHIAPAHSTYRALRSWGLRSWVTADLVPSRRISVRTDIARPGLRPASFDVVICLHVLEHVDDDHATLRALRDLVRPDGIVVIGVPVRDASDTLEDPNVTDPERRAELFGEPDHRRWYGADITVRIAAAGLTAESRPSAEASDEVRERFGLSDREGLFLCRPIAGQAK